MGKMHPIELWIFTSPSQILKPKLSSSLKFWSPSRAKPFLRQTKPKPEIAEPEPKVWVYAGLQSTTFKCLKFNLFSLARDFLSKINI